MPEILNYSSPIGLLELRFVAEYLVSLKISNATSAPSLSISCSPAAQAVYKWLDDYFDGLQPDIRTLALRPHGTDFQKQVWNQLLQIPYGESASYKQIANQIAHETGRQHMSAQAVGQAVGANPIWIIIPCHRVLGANGQLTGYAGGLDAKIRLLEHEKIDYRK